MPNIGLRSLYLVLQLRHFERSQNFPLSHEVADVDLDPANVSGDFGVKIDLLVWLKLAGNG
jgi:hypothetical protein